MGDSGGGGQQHRYHFNNTGVVRDLVYPNKAILLFRLHGKEEKAILLSKVVTLDGKALDENKQISEFIKVGDVIEFDCHIYDKGGVGSGKDKCNYYAMRAWRNSKNFDAKAAGASGGGATTPILRNNGIQGTGWISELSPRKGVLTFDNHGRDERVLFLASKVWFFEKRLGARQPLTDVLSEGDPVQFEAAQQEPEEHATHYCAWFANVVYKGRRPAVVEASEALLGRAASPLARRASLPSETCNGDDKADLVGGGGVINGRVNEDVIKGVGMIAKVINDKSGIIWWLKSSNHLQSVWFESKQTFLYGTNLADKNLLEIFNEGAFSFPLFRTRYCNCPSFSRRRPGDVPGREAGRVLPDQVGRQAGADHGQHGRHHHQGHHPERRRRPQQVQQRRRQDEGGLTTHLSLARLSYLFKERTFL